MTSNTASSVVWPWREKPVAPTKPKSTGPSPTAVVVQTAVMFAIGAFLYWGPKHHPVMGIAVWSLAAVVLVSGFFIPPVFAVIERFGQGLGKWVGILLTWGLLAPFYYLCFFPMHLVLIIRGKDPLQRQFSTPAPTYWTPHKPIADLSQYQKQF